jgi:polyisoprenoid-binding protein YceI
MAGWEAPPTLLERIGRVRRRILIISVIAPLVALAIGAAAAWFLIFGGGPTIQRAGMQTPATAVCSPATGASGGSSVFQIDATKSSASYEAHFQAEGQPLPGAVTGETGEVTGDIQLGTKPTPTVESLRVMVDLRTLNSGAADRDTHVRTDTLETDKYPFATFVASSAQALPDTYNSGQQASFPLAGDLTLHGVTRPATFNVTGQLSANVLTGSASANIRLPDFGMKPPQTTAVVKITVSDDILLKITFTAPASCVASLRNAQEEMAESTSLLGQSGAARPQIIGAMPFVTTLSAFLARRIEDRIWR